MVVFSATLLLSASLLFLIQPMFGRFVLPLLGSTPAVWNTALLFFQATLLAGYLYAHLSTRWLGVRRQAALHLALLAVALLVLPIRVPEGWAPPTTGSPIPWLLALLTVAVGLPFFVVSASAPLLQRWLADTDTPAGRDPYFLYRASNLGSVLGLLGYPLVIEPSLRLAEQGRAWAGGYGLLVALMVASAVLVWRAPRPDGGEEAPAGSPTAAVPAGPPSDDAPDAARRVRWVALAYAPSSLLLGVTAFLSTDVAPVPLLWVVPLTLYLLTFVIAFSPSAPERVLPMVLRALPLWVTAFVMVLLVELKQPLALLVLLHLGTFFVVALACHTELARDRPPPRHLTGFYLWISLGGALGGAFNAIVAPLAFNATAEYPLAVIVACLLLPATAALPPGRWWLDFALPLALAVLVGGALLALRSFEPAVAQFGKFVVVGLGGAALLAFGRRPVRLGLGVAALVTVGGIGLASERTIFLERSFFGVHRVQVPEGTRVHRLVHGSTIHGAQDGTRPTEPLAYYHRGGPVGDVFGSLPDRGPRRAGVIGLGTGTIACYGRAGERWTFFEIDPVVRRMARDPALFTYLRDCPARADVVLGDARLSLRRQPDGAFDVLVADAFNSDAIPVHLLTREALDLYRSKLAPDGVLLFNISNRYLKLEPVLGNVAHDQGLACFGRDQQSPELRGARNATPSHWLAMAGRPADLGRLPARRGWHRCARDPGARAWTDDYSNLLAAL